ncbi:response regulator [[Phormidium] sp. ETS-05]|uniref:sensor histidine kinase n=1 Tax=[Phormidium] sp. ETS-05 TaxID=222819 RepID=UPI0018EEE13B|nr:response regulator [[Phormidium] sp. ETS-05]
MNPESLQVEFFGKDILIVDDMPVNLRVLNQILTQHGYKVRKALSGEMALTACEATLPDLILLDILMPDLDGYEVCSRLKSQAKTRKIPVIFLSALDEAEDKVKAFHVGAADYISKPFQVEEVLARVTHQLTIVHLNQQLANQNAQLQKLNAELMRSNAELEQFAYVASHDLQSPLQATIGYADMLLWKYDSVLDENAKHYVNQIVQSGLRMKNLIQDLLAYSRLGNGQLDWQPVEAVAALQDALENLRQEIAATGAQINHSELPKVRGDRTQLTQLFQNLLSNAIKFRRSGVTPQINISCVAGDRGESRFAVSDNGIGIPEEKFDCIFEAFHRLHGYQEYPGTGLGMAICKRIVTRHGGRIWVNSQPGEGTTFYFTLDSLI